MVNSLACHAGDIVLLRAEIIGIGSEGPLRACRDRLGWSDLFLGADCSSPRLSVCSTHRTKPLGACGGISPQIS